MKQQSCFKWEQSNRNTKIPLAMSTQGTRGQWAHLHQGGIPIFVLWVLLSPRTWEARTSLTPKSQGPCRDGVGVGLKSEEQNRHRIQSLNNEGHCTRSQPAIQKRLGCESGCPEALFYLIDISGMVLGFATLRTREGSLRHTAGTQEDAVLLCDPV